MESEGENGGRPQTVPDRPLVKKSKSREDYEDWVREYIRARAEQDTAYPHHGEDYALVVDCPLCDGPSMIEPLSVGDAPRWTCKTSYAPGHAVRVEGEELVAQDFRTGRIARSPRPDSQPPDR